MRTSGTTESGVQCVCCVTCRRLWLLGSLTTKVFHSSAHLEYALSCAVCHVLSRANVEYAKVIVNIDLHWEYADVYIA